MWGIIKELRLLFRMVIRDLRSKYVGSLGGIFWTVLNPLLLLLVFTFVFSIVFRAKFGSETGIGISALYILTGLIPWLGFQEGVARSSGYLIDNRNLISRVKFPVEVLPLVPVLSGFLGQLIGFLVIIFWAGFKGKLFISGLCFLPLWMIFQVSFTLGLSYFFSVLGVWVRDLIQLLPVLLLVWMYGTPIFYPENLVPESFQFMISLNPFAQLVIGYRELILEGRPPELGNCLMVSGWVLVSLGIGSAVFYDLRKSLSDRV